MDGTGTTVTLLVEVQTDSKLGPPQAWVPLPEHPMEHCPSRTFSAPLTSVLPQTESHCQSPSAWNSCDLLTALGSELDASKGEARSPASVDAGLGGLLVGRSLVLNHNTTVLVVTVRL